MADGTHIQWSDATWNIITGCSITSPGCTNCYAMKLAGSRLRHHPSRVGLTEPSKAGPVWTGEVRFNEQWLDQPLRWKRPRKIFVCAHGDLFHENVPDDWIDRVFAVMALCPQHTFQVLTKREERMYEYLIEISEKYAARPYDLDDHLGGHGDEIAPDRHGGALIDMTQWPIPNVWLGVTAENQEQADARIPDLLATPAAKRLVSVEPMLGPVSLAHIRHPLFRGAYIDALDGHVWHEDGCVSLTDHPNHPALDWVICGGESGPGARNSDFADHARALRDQCASAGVKFFGKQDFGGKPMPADLDITEFPA